MKHQPNNIPTEIVAATSILRMSDKATDSSRFAVSGTEHTAPNTSITHTPTVPHAPKWTQEESTSMTPYQKSPTLYVGDLHMDVGEPALYDIFQALGPIHSIRICRDRVTRRSLGYGYINFATVQDAERALGTMNYFSGPRTLGRPLRLMWSMRDPSSRRHGAGNVFVKGLAKTIDNKALHDTFSQFGQIWSCKIATDDHGASVGYGFVHFESISSAKVAISKVDGMLLEGAKVHVGHFKRRQEREAAGLRRTTTYTNVYVKNLEDTLCEEQALRHLFRAYGEITSVFIPRNEDGSPKLYAFLNFASSEMAHRAVAEMHGRLVDHDRENNTEDTDEGECGREGKKLYVCRAQKKAERVTELRKRFAGLRRERAERQEGQNLYVKNFSLEIDSERLRAHFAAAGTITSCAVMKDARGYSRGFGFVCFSTKDEASKAVQQFNGSLLDSKQLYVAIAQRKEARRAQIRAQRALFMPWMASSAHTTAAAHLPAPPNFIPPGAIYAQPSPYVYRHAQPPSPNAFITPSIPAMHPAVAHVPNYPGPVPPQAPMFAPHLRCTPFVPGFAPQNFVAQQHVRADAYPLLSPAKGSQQSRHHHRSPTYPPYLAQVTRNIHGAPHHGTAPVVTPQRVTVPTPTSPVVQNPEPLTVEMLTEATPLQRKDMLGVRLYPRVAAQNSDLATKITGMLLELDDPDVLHLLDTPNALTERVQEAERVLRKHAELIAKEKKQANEVDTVQSSTDSNALHNRDSAPEK